jgi:hypothetical protein
VDLPPEMKEKIIEEMSTGSKNSCREVSFGMKNLVDSLQRRSFRKWKRKTSNGDLVIAETFVDLDFAPPILEEVMKMSEVYRAGPFNLLNLHVNEEIKTTFYKQALRHFTASHLKTIYTLAVLSAFKHLTNSTFTTESLANELKVSFRVEDVYFGILWSSGSMNQFTFNDDAASFLSLIDRIIEIKRILAENPKSKLVNLLPSMDFGPKLVGVGSHVYFNRQNLKPAILNCDISLKGSRKIHEVFSSFLECSDFKVLDKCEDLKVEIKISSKEARKCGCSGDYYFRY